MVKIVCGALVALLWVSAAGSETFNPGTDPVFEKMLGLNKGLASYTAHVEVATHLLLGRFTLRGTLYNRGEQSKVVFDNVPAIAKSGVENQPSIGPAASWHKDYTITVASHGDDTTTYHLEPLAPGRVRSIDAVVQNATGLARRYVWTNSNGMTITSSQTYGPVGAYQLVQSSSTQTRGGGLPTDSDTTFTNYQLNVTVPDSIFAPQ